MRRNDLALLIAVLSLGAAPLAAQGEIEFRYGQWYRAGNGATYELRTHSPLTGVISQAFGATVLINDRLGRRQAFYGGGWEAHLFRGTSTFGPYGLLGVALGLSTDTAKQALAALWSVGGGLEWRPFGPVRSRPRGAVPRRGSWAAGVLGRWGNSAEGVLAFARTCHRAREPRRWGTVKSEPAGPLQRTPTAADDDLRQRRRRGAHGTRRHRHSVPMGWHGCERF